jgi:general secretion pathway protein G
MTPSHRRPPRRVYTPRPMPAPARRAMTLVEVLAVVVILGLLAATLAVGFSGAFGKGRRELARTGIGLIAGKVELYRLEYGAWPDASVGLAALSDGHAAPTAPYYIKNDQTLDPWGRSYQFVVPGPQGHPYEIVSLGADGVLGGEGEDADLSSINLRAK